MGRLADETVKLSDGSVIPKGAFTMVSLEKMRDDSIFTQPDEFIGSRFLKFRQRPGRKINGISFQRLPNILHSVSENTPVLDGSSPGLKS
ncbi:cytochrome P450 [Colletotrichum tofieldiae]|nr:cytochrome P450 [Colletotrichum tofieldiae]